MNPPLAPCKTSLKAPQASPKHQKSLEISSPQCGAAIFLIPLEIDGEVWKMINLEGSGEDWGGEIGIQGGWMSAWGAL